MKQIIKDSLDRYAQHHVETGSFLRAVLENDLKEAVCRADDDNLSDILEIIRYAHNEIPGNCWGSPGRVRKWLAMKPARVEVEA